MLVINGWQLVTENNQPVAAGDTVAGFGDVTRYTLEGGKPPHKPSSTGRVWVKPAEGRTCEYFPGVVGLKWVKLL